MLGSLQDAEDALQETLLAAWQGFGGFERRASLRTWLYKIATNRCLNARRSAARRPAAGWDIPGGEPPPPAPLGGGTWLQPFPHAPLDGARPPGPDARYEPAQSGSLAVVPALRLLRAGRPAGLTPRAVLGSRASGVAAMLAATVESATSALNRAGASLHRQPAAPAVGRELPPGAGSAAEQAIADRFARAWQ